jgi:hypothetical protein
MIHVDEATSEVWVPTILVDNAADQIETSRRAIQAELAERGVTSSNLSGARVSEAVSRGATAMRFWRLDLTHEDVPEPELVLDEIEDPLDAGPSVRSDDGDSSAAAADGGSEVSHGTERFGRPPDGPDSAEDGDDDADDDADAGAEADSSSDEPDRADGNGDGDEGDPPDGDGDSSGTDDEPDEDGGDSGGEA